MLMVRRGVRRTTGCFPTVRTRGCGWEYRQSRIPNSPSLPIRPSPSDHRSLTAGKVAGTTAAPLANLDPAPLTGSPTPVWCRTGPCGSHAGRPT